MMIIPALAVAILLIYLRHDYVTWKRSQIILSRLERFRLP